MWIDSKASKNLHISEAHVKDVKRMERRLRGYACPRSQGNREFQGESNQEC